MDERKKYIKPGSRQYQVQRQIEKEKALNLKRLEEEENFRKREIEETMRTRKELSLDYEIEFMEEIRARLMETISSQHAVDRINEREVEMVRILGAFKIANDHNRMFISNKFKLYGKITVETVEDEVVSVSLLPEGSDDVINIDANKLYKHFPWKKDVSLVMESGIMEFPVV
jgi:G3E family GTPase